MEVDETHVLQQLSMVIDEQYGRCITDINMVSAIVVNGNSVGFVLEFGSKKEANDKIHIIEQCKKLVLELPGIEKVKVLVSFSNTNKKNSPNTFSGVRKTIMICSGKGGVGKSTAAAGLAFALSKAENRVALLDVDVYGPSIPGILGITGQIEIDKLPITKNGIAAASVGHILPKENAAMWRGPIISKFITQLMNDVRWGERDYLFIDTPPGTGDIHLTLADKLDISGAVLICTPQLIALNDVVKAYDMLRKLDIKILGVLENMSYIYRGPDKEYLFGKGNTQRFCKEKNLCFLGEIPIDASISRACDEGYVNNFTHEIIEIYKDLAQKIITALS